MILKLGYTDVDGINVYRYIEDFQELKITSFLTRKYKYYPSSQKIIYDKKHEMLKVDLMFSDKVLTEGITKDVSDIGPVTDINSLHVCVTHITFLDNKTNTYQSYACLADSVYLMNDNGKTIDKY